MGDGDLGLINKTFLILGGYGNTGRWIAELLLLQRNDVQLILAGRNFEKAKVLADQLNQKFNGHRVSALRVDVRVASNLKDAFVQVDMVIVASSTIDYIENIAKAALTARIDYLDIQLSITDKIKILEAMRDRIERAGCCFITDAGFHPGLPATLVRYAIPHFDQFEVALVASVMQLNWKKRSFSEKTLTEFFKELNDYQPLVFKSGSWMSLGDMAYKTFDFGYSFGEQYCVPMFIEELRSLPEKIPSLKEVGFFIAGFNWFTDCLIIPLSSALVGKFPKAVKPLGKLFGWGLRRFGKPPYGAALMLEASGWRKRKYFTMQIKVIHGDAFFLTAAAVVACLLQYLEGSIHKPGLWYQAHIVEPQRMLSDMEGLGVLFEINNCKE